MMIPTELAIYVIILHLRHADHGDQNELADPGKTLPVVDLCPIVNPLFPLGLLIDVDFIIITMNVDIRTWVTPLSVENISLESRGFRGPPGPKPVEVGKEYEVEVTEISRQGDGIARVQGFVVL